MTLRPASTRYGANWGDDPNFVQNDDIMAWPFDASDGLVTPAEAVERMRQRSGSSVEAWRLPSLMVATFQSAAHQRLAQRAGVDAPRSFDAPLGLGLTGEVPVAVARIGVGAPIAAIVLEEAIARGVRTVLVVGSAGSLHADLRVGDSVIVTGAEREDGTSHHYLPAGSEVTADPELTARLASAAVRRGLAPRQGRAWTIDAPYRETVAAITRHREAGVLVVEMEAAAIFAVAQVRGVRAALLVAISDELSGPGWGYGFSDTRYRDALLASADAAMDCALELGA